METILGVILSIFIGFWLLGIIGKFLLRYWIINKQRQMEEQMKNGNFKGFTGFGNFGGFQGQSSQSEQNKRQEGEITVEKKQQKSQNISKKIGEYVDYEDIK